MTGGAALAIAMGDPAGVGPEIIAKSWVVRTLRSLPPFAMVGDAGAVARVWDGPIEVIDDIAEAPVVFDRALPVLAVEPAGDVVPGTATISGARAALSALECAIALAQRGAAKALVTGPVSKAQLYGVAAEDAVMMLAGPSLRVVPLTAHVPLAAVPSLLSVDLLVTKARTTATALRRDFGIAAPRLAFAGVNPHAGESGTIGRETFWSLRSRSSVPRASTPPGRSRPIRCSMPAHANIMMRPCAAITIRRWCRSRRSISTRAST